MKNIFIALFSVIIIVGFSSFSDDQLIKTQLHLTIRDELGNTVEGVTVQLFEKEDDYKKETNASAEGKTDARGIVKFKELKPIVYHVIAKKDDKNNFGGGEETGKLQENKINKATIIIE
jgi:hypothetical protein